jgi:RNA polymerase sigma-70 factor (ECF subfamily)
VNSHTDIELIQRTLNGETNAFGELIKRYQDAVYATALHRIGNFADAQDIAQETFIEAYKSLHKLREIAKFPGWLHRIALHQCNRWRRKQRESEPIEELSDAQILEISNGKTVLPDEALERKELQQTVLNAITSLPQKLGEVVTMYYIDGLSYDEIANFLSTSKTTVKGRLQMGRKQLKEELIIMVEETLKQSRPDERFSEKILTEIIEQTKAARQRDAHDEVMQLCEKALEVLEHLDMTEEHKRTQVDVLSWQSDEWLKWFGEPENALENFQRAERISTELSDHESQAKWMMMQAIALSRMEKYREMVEPVQNARAIYGNLGETKSQIVCDAILDLAHLLPEGWERVDIPPELHTGYGIHRYSLTRTQEAIMYLGEDPRKWTVWCEVVVPYQMRRGYEVFRNNSLLASMGQQTQILLLPVKIGRSWQETLETRHGEKLTATRSIEETDDIIVVPAGRFEKCLRVKTVIPEPDDADFSQETKTYDRRKMCGARTMWFAPGVGLVKYRHDDGWGDSLTVQLLEYHIEDNEPKDYLPLSIGNRWKYERYMDWCRTKVTENYRVVAREDETVHIACSMYSELLDDAEQQEYFQTWLEYEKASADIRGQILMLHRLTGVHARLGNLEAALEIYRQVGELMERVEDDKLQMNLLLYNEYEMPVEFLSERTERGLRLAEEIGDLESQRRGLKLMADFYLQHGEYAQALKSAQRTLPIVISFSNVEDQVFTEAEIDLAKSLIADPDGECAIKGGCRSLSRVQVSDSEVICKAGGGIIPIACDKRPYPPIYDHAFWADAPLLKLPAKKGETWSSSNHDGQVERVIKSVGETVSVPAGKFDECVQVKTTMRLRAANEGSPQANEIYNCSKGFREGEKWMWFAPGVGIVRVEHHHQNGKRTVIELTSYQIKEDSKGYFLLAIGNRWNYEWRDENSDLLFKEQNRVILEHEGQFYIACSGYTTNAAEYGK